MLFNKTKRLKISKSDLYNNISVFKANKKIFMIVSTFNKYIKRSKSFC